MDIDPATRRNLELTESLSGERGQSLLGCIDRTVTAAARGCWPFGSERRSPMPRRSAAARQVALLHAEGRLARGPARAFCAARPTSRARCRACCSAAAARAIWRLCGQGLAAAGALKQMMAEKPELPAGLKEAVVGLGDHATLVAELARALGPELPVAARDGGFIASGYRAELDELRALRDESRRADAGSRDPLPRRKRDRLPQDPPQRRAGLFPRGPRRPIWRS